MYLFIFIFFCFISIWSPLFYFETSACHFDPTTWQIKRHLSIFTVLSRPTVLRHPKNVSIYLEDKAITVIFTCEASGFPLPVISWLKNNSTATSGTLIQNGSISSLVLRLKNRVEHPAKYRCIAKNSLGETSSKEATLVIRPQTHSLGVKKYLYSSMSFLLTFLHHNILYTYLMLCLLACLFVCLFVSLSFGLVVC